MQVKTTNGITIDLTKEQIEDIDRQVKAQSRVPDIKERVKTWEDALFIVIPEYYVSSVGSVTGMGRPRKSTDLAILTMRSHVSSERQANSVRSYSQLLVIFEALNEGWKPDFNDSHQPWTMIYYNTSSNIFITGTYKQEIKTNLILKNIDLALHVIRNFDVLLREYFMIQVLA